MSAGPEHYREAERLAGQAEKLFGEYVDAHDADGNTPDVDLIRRQAEHCREMGGLHATLALAAATAMQPSGYGSGQPEFTTWDAVAGVQPETAKGGDGR